MDLGEDLPNPWGPWSVLAGGDRLSLLEARTNRGFPGTEAEWTMEGVSRSEEPPFRNRAVAEFDNQILRNVGKERTRGWQDGSEDASVCREAWQPGFNP